MAGIGNTDSGNLGTERSFKCFVTLTILAIACLVSLSVTKSALAEPTDSGFIRQQGMQILNERGEPVILRGVNLGGWLMWEAWMWGGLLSFGNSNSETAILRSLTDAVGAERVKRFQRQVYDSYITEDDVRRIKELGYNSVRVPFNHSFIEDTSCLGCLSIEGLKILDRLLSWCKKYQIYAILDLHSAPGGQSFFFTSDPEQTSLWESEENQNRTVALWRSLASHYKDTPWLAGYDLLNEPYTFDSGQLSRLYQRISQAIREVDDRHIIFIEGNFAAHILNVLQGEPPENSVYSFHAYPYGNRDLYADLQNHIAFARRNNRPLWVGEFGEISKESLGEWTAVYKSTPEIVGWSAWTWKRVATENPAPQTFFTAPPWQFVIIGITLGWDLNWLNVDSAMNQFIDLVRIQNTFENTDYAFYTQ